MEDSGRYINDYLYTFVMSRLLESEQESESGSENLASSGSIALSKHEEQKRELGVENRLEQYSRRLSQLALVDTNESSDSSEKEEVFVQGSLRSQQSLKASIQSSSHGHTGAPQKVMIKFQSIGSITSITPSVCQISTNKPFSVIISFLQRKLKMENIHCYINNSFAPVPSQNVGDLWNQFKVNDELIVSYCGSVAFG